MSPIHPVTTSAPAVLGALALGLAAHAQWSSDPAVNLALADRSGDQVQAKLRPTADGGAYVSWFDNNAGGYDVYLQRLDAGGNEMWAHNGVLVADRSFSSTQDYGLAIDSTGNALLAFRDDRAGGIQITAAMIEPDGTLTWGSAGVQVTSGSAFFASPKIAGATDGSIVVAWTNDNVVKLQRLDASGAPQWGAGVTLSDPGGADFMLADLHPAEDGDVIVSVVRAAGFTAPKHIVAQKFSPAGALLWGANHVPVFDGGSLQFGNFPPFIPDGSGGAVFGWYTSSPSLQVYAQHIDAGGNELFPHNGSVGSTAMQNRVSPSVGYNPATQETFLFWTETDGSQSQDGVSGQKFDAAGNRHWTDSGKVIVPQAASSRIFVRTVAYDDGAMVFWIDSPSFGTDVLLGSRVDTNGDFVWAPTVIDVCSIPASKSRPVAAMSTAGFAMIAWSDERAGDDDIFAQNVNGDGSLGPSASNPADINGDGVVDVLDLLALLSAWGPCPGCAEDVNGDGVVDVVDLLAVLSAWTM